MVDLVRQAQAEHPEGTTAILVRARSHFAAIIPALKQAGIPYQAQDLDNLAQRQSIQDLRSLTRALLHPADRVSWLAILRAPWCGMTLDDLHGLISGDKFQNVWDLLHAQPEQGQLFSLLSADGEARWQQLRPRLSAALQLRGSIPLRSLVESTWLGLYGPACIPAVELPDAERFFSLLEEFDCGGDLLDFEQFDRRLEELYASPDPEAGPSLQLMTIHKAKGLQFDTVILPGLGRSTRAMDSPLLNWVEHPDYQLLLAPVRRTDSGSPDPTYEAIQELHKDRNELETARMIYVATTRAIGRLHLIGHVNESADGALTPSASSLLGRLWSSLEPMVEFYTRQADPEVTDNSESSLFRLPTAWSPPTMHRTSRPEPRPLSAPQKLRLPRNSVSASTCAVRRDELSAIWFINSSKNSANLVGSGHHVMNSSSSQKLGVSCWFRLESLITALLIHSNEWSGR